MKLIIDRERWIRNEGPFKSWLLRSDDGKMCCLGFYLLANGVPEEAIADLAAPFYLKSLPEAVSWLVKTDKYTGGPTNSDDVAALMHLNDEVSGDDPGREAALIKRFAEHGVELVFVDRAESRLAGDSTKDGSRP